MFLKVGSLCLFVNRLIQLGASLLVYANIYIYGIRLTHCPYTTKIARITNIFKKIYFFQTIICAAHMNSSLGTRRSVSSC